MNIYEEGLADLVNISVCAGRRVDYVQAGGGNTSVKFEDGRMAIKASGYRLKDMTVNSGFVCVDGASVKKYHCEEHDAAEDCNKAAMEIAMNGIHEIHGEKPARPSVEVGFHSVLKKYVLHLHPVYVNVLMCCSGGAKRALEIVEKRGLRAAWVPYSMPGYDLTKLILSAFEKYQKETGQELQVIFLKNHGVLTTADTPEEVLWLMDEVNESIKEELRLPQFPDPCVEPCECGYKSGCGWLREVIKDRELVRSVRYEPIYPDQLVYTANEMSIEKGDDNKIVVSDSDVFYHTSEKEAIVLDETMTALFYIYSQIKAHGFSFDRLTEEECSKILGWDSEKYRKSLMSAEL